MDYKYGEFSQQQIHDYKQRIRKDIFYILIIADPETNKEMHGDVTQSLHNLMTKIGGLNSLLFEPPEIISVLCFLQMAYEAYSPIESSEEFRKSAFRKLILDAGAEVLKIKEV